MAFVRALGRLILHVVIAFFVALVVGVLVIITLTVTGLYDADGFPWSSVAALLAFVGYGAWRFFRVEVTYDPGAPPIEQPPKMARGRDSASERTHQD